MFTRMENKITTYTYNGSQISFKSGAENMINATEMAKPFGKSVSEWRRLPSTISLIEALTETKGFSHSLVSTSEGRNGGTWMHEDLAIEFARWLNPRFAIWCNDRIKELMKYGITASQPTIEAIINDPAYGIKLLQALQAEREEKARIAAENNERKMIIEQNRPKVDFATAVENSDTLILIRDLAKILKQNGYDTGEVRLYEKLRKDGYLTLANAPTQRSMELSVMRVVENVITTPNGSKIKPTTKITGKGQIYFCNRYAGHNPIQGTLMLKQS